MKVIIPEFKYKTLLALDLAAIKVVSMDFSSTKCFLCIFDSEVSIRTTFVIDLGFMDLKTPVFFLIGFSWKEEL